MKCPKCLKEQPSNTQCEYCGVIFQKYHDRIHAEVMQSRSQRNLFNGPMNVNLSVMHKVLGALCILGLGVFVLLTMFIDIDTFYATILSIYCGFLSCVHFIIAHGARKGKTWARVASCIIAALMLTGFPVGTAFGVYLLIHAISKWESASEYRLA